MPDWIPFKEGEYLVEQAFLFAADNSAVNLEDPIIRIYKDKGGRRQMDGNARIRNILMVNLLDEHDNLDLALDLGADFTYLLENPEYKAGKVFSPDVKSTLQFAPRKPWERISQEEFRELFSRLVFLT
jgi:hypothetical protein